MKILNAMLEAVVGIYILLGAFMFYRIIKNGLFIAIEPNPTIALIEFEITLLLLVAWAVRWVIKYSCDDRKPCQSFGILRPLTPDCHGRKSRRCKE